MANDDSGGGRYGHGSFPIAELYGVDQTTDLSGLDHVSVRPSFVSGTENVAVMGK